MFPMFDGQTKSTGHGKSAGAKEAEESRRDGKQFAHIHGDRGSPDAEGAPFFCRIVAPFFDDFSDG